MKHLLALLGLLAGTSGFAANRNWVTPDFFIQKGPAQNQQIQQANCRETIRAKMCLVDPSPGQEDHERPCLTGGEQYADVFETLYDHMPIKMQRMFCSLRVIYVENHFFGTAYGGLMTGPDNKPSGGAVMGIRRSVLDSALKLQHWATWKEQLSFGGVNDDKYDLTPGLQEIETHTEEPVQDFLYFAVAHEFGHMFDFANRLNASGEWTSLSWNLDPLSQEKATPRLDFKNRDRLCFYWCKDPLKKSDMSQLYKDWSQSDFISLYATTQQWDDWADSVAYFTAHENLHFHYEIRVPGGERLDIMERLTSPLFERKLAYLKHFFSRPDIVYP